MLKTAFIGAFYSLFDTLNGFFRFVAGEIMMKEKVVFYACILLFCQNIHRNISF